MKNRSGVVGLGCGFQSDENQKPTALCPGASCPTSLVQGVQMEGDG